MKVPLLILFGALLTVLTATALGTLLLRALSIRLYRLEERLLGFVTGAACLSGVTFALCAIHLVHKGVFLAVSALIAGAAIYLGAYRSPPAALPAVPKVWKWVFGVIFAAFTVLYFFNAMAPENSPDGATYHLPFMAAYYRAHGFVRVTTDMYASLPQGVEMLFLFAYAFGRYSASTLIHFSFLAALPWLMLCYARRFGFTRAGAAAGIWFFASPVVGMDGSNAYVDVALAAVLFALFYFLQIWAEFIDNHLLVPIGILAGFAFAIKPTAFLALPYAIGLISWKLWRARKPALRPALAVAGLALLSMLPWLIKNWIWVANPFSPFANRIFPNPYIHISFEDTYWRYLRVYGLKSYKQIPYELTIHGEILTGLFGPLFVLAPLSLLALRTRQGRQLLLATAVFGATYFSNVGARFLIPVVPFLSLAMGIALLRFPQILMVLVLAHAVASWPNVLEKYCSQYAWRLEKAIPFKPALRIESEDSYLSQRSSGYVMNRMLEELVPPGEIVFSTGPDSMSYTTRKLRMDFKSASNQVLMDILLIPIFPDFQPSRLLTFHFPERTSSKIRVVQTASTVESMWSIAELRVYDAGKEVPRAARWRLAAQPNPWDVQMAFDNDPISRWRSWQPARPGMHVDVDFGGPQKLDAVTIQTAPDSQESMIRLETLDSGGKWLSIGGQPRESSQSVTAGLRRAATAQLKLHGIRYLLSGYGDWNSDDLYKHTRDWGLRLLGDRGEARLYYIE